MVVRELVALMGVKTDKKGFDQANKGMGNLISLAKKAAIAFASLATIKVIKGIVIDITQLGDRFDKLSKRTGIATKTLQELDHAAALSGASLGDVETALRRLQAAQVDADAGLKTYTREWDRLGVEIKDANGEFKSTPELLIEIADGMKGLESDAERTAVATKLLGRSGSTLIPMFKEGSQALRDMMGELSDYGGLIESDMIKASADFVDGQRRMDMVLQGLKLTLSKEVVPWVNEIVASTLKWWKANGKWVREDIIAPLGKLVRILGRAASVVGKVVFWFIKLVKNMHPGIKGLIVFIAVLSKWQKILMIILSPLGKLLIGIGFLILLFDDLNTFLKGGDSLFGRFVKKVEEFLGLPIEEEVRNIIGWFGKLAEDPGQAMDDLVEGIKQFAEAIRYFFMEFIPDMIGDGLKLAFGEESFGIIDAFVEGIKSLLSIFLSVVLAPLKAIKGIIVDTFEIGIMGALDNLGKRITGWLSSISDKVFGFGTKLKKAFNIFRKGGSISDIGSALTGGGAVGGSSIGAGSKSSVVNAPNTTIQATINAGPGMNEKALARESTRQIANAQSKVYRKTMKSITQGAA